MPKSLGAMLDEHVPFLEGIGIEQQGDALAGGEAPLGMLCIDAALAAAARGRALLFQLLEDFLHPPIRSLSLISKAPVVISHFVTVGRRFCCTARRPHIARSHATA